MMATTTETRVYAFSLILAGVDVITPETAEAIYGACDDTTACSRDGVVTVYFDREAASLGDAIGSAVKDVERAGLAVAKVVVEAAR